MGGRSAWIGFYRWVRDRCFAAGETNRLSLVIAIAIERDFRGRSIRFGLLARKFGLTRIDSKSRFGRCWCEPTASLRPFADGVRGFRVGCFAQAALGALNALLEREFFRFVELFLTSLRITKKLEGSLILLVIQVIEPVAQQMSGASARGHSVHGRAVVG